MAPTAPLRAGLHEGGLNTLRHGVLNSLRLLCMVFLALLLAGCQVDLPLKDLKDRYGSGASRFLPMDGIEVHWRDEGPADAPVLLLLHGTASSLHTWDGWVEQLRPQWRIVRLDLPGFGLTGPHPSDDYSTAAMIDFLDRFVKAAGLTRFAIAGNSLGGQYAWRFALRHPEQVSALILIDAAGYPLRLEGPGTLGLRLARMPVVGDLLRLAPVEGFTRNGLNAVYGDRSRVGEPLVTRHAELMLRPGNRAALSARARTVDPRDDSWRQLPRLSVPTLVLWGERDTWIKPDFGKRFAQDIPGARLITYPDLGHVPMEEDPVRTARDTAAFLRQTSRGLSR